MTAISVPLEIFASHWQLYFVNLDICGHSFIDLQTVIFVGRINRLYLNQKIQLAKRRARGFAVISNFIDMAYFVSGKLKFDYPYNSL